MKKVIFAALVALGMVSVAHATDTTVFGMVEYEYQMSNGVNDVVSDDTYVGVKVSEDLGSGSKAYAVVKLMADSEGAGDVTSGDMVVGLKGKLGGNMTADMRIGRMDTIQKLVAESTVDMFNTAASVVTVDGDTGSPNMVFGSLDFGGLTVMGSSVSDGAAGEEKIDMYELGASTTVAGVDVYGVYSDNKVTGVDTWLVAASTKIDAFGLAASFERDDVAGTDVDTYNIVGSYDIGNNTVKVGYMDGDGKDSAWQLEGVHSFSKSTYLFGSYVDQDNNDAIASIGLGMMF